MVSPVGITNKPQNATPPLTARCHKTEQEQKTRRKFYATNANAANAAAGKVIPNVSVFTRRNKKYD